MTFPIEIQLADQRIAEFRAQAARDRLAASVRTPQPRHDTGLRRILAVVRQAAQAGA